MNKIFTKAQIVKNDATTNTFTAVASTATVDRHGEIVSPDGWNLENFKSNPVLLWSHDHTIPAIGKATNVWVDGIGEHAKLKFTGVWQTVTNEGKAAAQLVADGILNSFSVGFIPKEMVGNTYTEQELLEISLVNVPANPDAMVLAYKSLKDNGFSDQVAKSITQQFAGMGTIKKDLFKTERGAIQDEIDEEAIFEAKAQNMRAVWDIVYALCDVYFADETSVDDFKPLINEFVGIVSALVGDDATVTDAVDPTVVVDNTLETSKTDDDPAKTQSTVAPTNDSKSIRARQTLTKAIVTASDKLLSNKSESLANDESVKLAKIIKRAGEILSKSNKEDLRNG